MLDWRKCTEGKEDPGGWPRAAVVQEGVVLGDLLLPCCDVTGMHGTAWLSYVRSNIASAKTSAAQGFEG